ncbi:hypothetical protein [Kitasatospora purpeofusca]|uniref:hypothetical protein n=1 Tax=Kitasatospora purpeofusca TaxID=67352 RepID=UPI0038042617
MRRLRLAVLAAAAATALVVAVPTSANAATGVFEFQTGTPPLGIPGLLLDPPSGECINLPGATSSSPAFAPKNLTNSTATVFIDLNCDGDTYYVMDPGKILGNRVKVRSVNFQ